MPRSMDESMESTDHMDTFPPMLANYWPTVVGGARVNTGSSGGGSGGAVGGARVNTGSSGGGSGGAGRGRRGRRGRGGRGRRGRRGGRVSRAEGRVRGRIF
ncbi:uncharacterized protein LOC144914144 [Branchiostoma floridae x Branchiostoma belcheri]